jgi:xanthine dehydrogenase molybdenum-binding subunit
MAPETSAARLQVGQDGAITLHAGAVDMGQGAETVLCQIAADAVGVPVSLIRLNPFHDTDVNCYDHGAFASRQTYIVGNAIKKSGALLREKIISCAGTILNIPPPGIDLVAGYIVEAGTGKQLLDMSEVAIQSLFYLKDREHLAAQTTFTCTENPLSTAACFAEIEVDLPLGKIKVKDIINIHDSGTIINPKTAESIVYGGMGMSLGCATLEELIYDEKGILLNNNMLDYKLPSSADLPDFKMSFVDSYEPTGPDGAKSLAELPIMIPVCAVRNALLHATGVAFNDLPMSPQRLVKRFCEAGLIRGV